MATRPALHTAWASYLAVALSLAALARDAAADPGVFRGPYLNDVTTDAITVLWESPEPTTGIVHYGVESVDEHSFSSGTPAIHHGVRLTGLSALAEPGSRFIYELEVGGERHAGSFFTAVTGDAPFGFIVYGDNRSSPEQHQAVVDALMAEVDQCRFVVNTGDMVSDGFDEAQWDTFFTIERPVLSRLPVYLAIGNHEVDDGRWDVPRRIFEHPTQVPPASNDEAFYHFVYGNAQLIVLNIETDTLYSGLLSLLGGDQEEWLQDVLDNPPNGVEHRFVFIHQGPYSSKPGRNGNFFLRTWLEDFDDAGIDLIISGHDHYAERGFAENGIHYVIHGGGGAPLYDTLGPRVVADHTIMYGETRLGYVLVEVDGPRVEVSIKGLSGETVDDFVFGDEANPGCVSPTECGAPPSYGCIDGGWECVNHACRFSCDPDLLNSLVTCLSDQQCEESLGDQCPGEATCEMPDINPLEWHCLCDVSPQCVSDANCTGREPPIEDCDGTWACQDEVCEFTPDEVCDPDGPIDVPDDDGAGDDPGDETADAGSPDPEPDLGPQSDASSDGDETADPTDETPADDGQSTGAGPGPGPDEGCGCRSAIGMADGWLALLLLALLLGGDRSARGLGRRLKRRVRARRAR